MLVKEGRRELLGSKGFELYRCSLLGVNVPDFRVLTTECFRKYSGEEMDDEILLQIEETFKMFGRKVAVRSSSIVEDLTDRSNAGIFRTVLNVVSIGRLIEAIREVWASSDGQDMAVVIQKQIDPEIAGVLFSRDPLVGNNETIIEYVEGLGDRLVSGRSDPVRIAINNDDGLSRSGKVSLDKGDIDLVPLFETSRFLESRYGYPLDMEWAHSGDEFHILQVRPITKLPPPKRGGVRTYSRVQAEQFYSGPVTPLFFSIFRRIFTEYYLKESIESLKLGLKVDEDLMVRYKNYLYVDTSIVEFALSMIAGRKSIEGFLEIVPRDIRDDLKKKNGGSLVSVLFKILVHILPRRELWISNLDEKFKTEVVPKILERLHDLEDPGSLDDDQLTDHYLELMNIMELHVSISKWGLALYSIPLMGAADDLLRRKGLSGYLPDLVSGFEDNRTKDAANEIKHLAEIARRDEWILEVLSHDQDGYVDHRRELERIEKGDRFIEYFENTLRMHGHRRISRDIFHPSWRDDPDIPFSILRKLAISDEGCGSDRNRISALQKRNAAVTKIRSRLAVKERLAFRIITRYLNRYVEFREFQRFYLDLILAGFREFILEVSNRAVEKGVLDHNEDIFFLKIDRVLELIEGRYSEGIKEEAEFNRISFENENGIPGRYLRNGISFDDVQTKKKSMDVEKGKMIVGQPVSSGAHKGKTIIMKELNDVPPLCKGDILVTKFIDPGQTHLFLMAGALVLEVGGLLSHGAILAREFGIPTVAGIRNATEMFIDGQRVAVDGTKGTVTILTEPV